jgi:hypothetical protein
MDEKVMHEGNKFLIRIGAGKYAYVEYHVDGGVTYIDSTFVPEEYRGQGLAEKLVKAAIEHAKQNKLKIVPICSYAKRYLDKHPEYRDLL